jgi:oleandomycin transport system ATP-binding protein
MQEAAIIADGLVKDFGDVRALDGVDFEAPRGAVLGLLGPNGAGKTTAIRILATLLRPDGGRAVVGGYDVVAQPSEVRRLIGLTGQYAAVDELLSGTENLYMIGRLLGMPARAARTRARELLGNFDLSEAAGKVVKTYSGGMRRRLDLAASLVGRPPFLYLDEPTTGLDPRSRRQLWDLIRDLVREGTSVLLTTQYLDEADQLADGIVVVDRGRVIAAGTSDELKAKVGGQVIEIWPEDPQRVDVVARVVSEVTGADATVDQGAELITGPIADTALVATVVRRLDESGVALEHLSLRRPSLDEVFLVLTGRPAELAAEGDDEKEASVR